MAIDVRPVAVGRLSPGSLRSRPPRSGRCCVQAATTSASHLSRCDGNGSQAAGMAGLGRGNTPRHGVAWNTWTTDTAPSFHSKPMPRERYHHVPRNGSTAGSP